MEALQVKAFAPASVANLGPGFDVLGLALEAPGDTVTVRRIPERMIRIAAIRGDRGKLSRTVTENTAGRAALELWKRARPDFGLEIEIEKGMTLGSGLGSSAASAVAAATAAAAVLGIAADDPVVLRAAGAGERVASRASHYDNVAAALFGGLIRVMDPTKPEIARIGPLPDWHLAVVSPDLVVRTSEARAALPPAVLSGAVGRLTSRVDTLVAACLASDLERAGAAIMSDDVITPHRARLIKGYDRAIAAALRSGAAGAGISGSGPALFALAADRRAAEAVGAAMAAAFKADGVQSQARTSVFGAPGARLL